jgi:hypothetical protein
VGRHRARHRPCRVGGRVMSAFDGKALLLTVALFTIIWLTVRNRL